MQQDKIEDKIDNEQHCECGNVELCNMLRSAGLRPTKQRVSLAHLLFSKGDRHISAEHLHEEATKSGFSISLATIYNALHQFHSVGLLREVSIDSAKTYYDTNTSHHHHFFVEDENKVIDIPANSLSVQDLPEPPEGMEIAKVDVVVRLRKKS
jgi:Fur family iron response transcriptional regulator